MRVLEGKAVSGTWLLDREKKSRSFQNAAMTFHSLVQEVMRDCPGGMFLCEGGDRPTGGLLIQHEETDWEFLKRAASILGTDVVADVRTADPRLWIGLPRSMGRHVFTGNRYTAERDETFYLEGGEESGLSRAMFTSFRVEGADSLRLFDEAEFRGRAYVISAKRCRLERGLLKFEYTLSQPEALTRRRRYNGEITGLTLWGEVQRAEDGHVRVRLDIDSGREAGAEWPFPWEPATGNICSRLFSRWF
jgi:hypothetical protein